MILQLLDELSEQLTDVIFYKINIDEKEDIFNVIDIITIPTFHFYKDNNKIDEITGVNWILLKQKIIDNK